MSFNDKFAIIRNGLYEASSTIFKILARPFGYPENPGMPTIYDIPSKAYAKMEFIRRLPQHTVRWPPPQRPETWFEVLFGAMPKPEPVPRYMYESKEEGFYNFYIENYKNIFFLPDPVSEFIQVKLNMCIDISVLETLREAIFCGCVIYVQLVSIRIALLWLIYINPYTTPWFYVAAAVDWVEETFHGFLPSIFGVNLSISILLGAIGGVADAVNQIVFTMPFLPSEGEQMKLIIDQELRDVIVFHYLPISWYRYPIPNDLREYWYTERPDILDYMQKSYRNFDIQFLPNGVLQELNHQANIISQTNNSEHIMPTQILSNKLFSVVEVFHNYLPIQPIHII